MPDEPPTSATRKPDSPARLGVILGLLGFGLLVQAGLFVWVMVQVPPEFRAQIAPTTIAVSFFMSVPHLLIGAVAWTTGRKPRLRSACLTFAAVYAVIPFVGFATEAAVGAGWDVVKYLYDFFVFGIYGAYLLGWVFGLAALTGAAVAARRRRAAVP